MRISVLALISFTLLSICSCTDERHDEVVNLSIPSGQTLSHPLGNIPTEGGIEIDQAPRHATISHIVIDTTEGGLIYEYQSFNDYKGIDELTLKKYSSIGNTDYIVRYERLIIIVE